MQHNDYQLLAQEHSAPVKMWTHGVPVEPEAREQLLNTAKMPFIFKHLAVMPDVHLGKGSTIGSVIPTKGAIIPAAVGVDIGCGMIAVRTSLLAADLPDNLGGLRSAIEQAVPHGRSVNRSKRDKGAVSAQKGQMGIIPGSMGAKSFIVRGLGNEESFCSCSHGAGRTMSRTAAKKRFTVEDQIRATAHVECRKDSEVIDEIPMAYKDIDAVMAAQNALVEVVHTLRQVVCVKG